MALIEFSNKGLYCPQAKVYIDPWKKVSSAIITHGHSDHARWGHKHYLCVHSSVPILKHRLGHDISIQGIRFGESLYINGVEITLFPAGHITGSAQVRLAHKDEIWVITGDYKLQNDGLSEAFEPVQCTHFITECTFGLPVYTWPAQSTVMSEINQWWQTNASEGRPSLMSAYSLGKAQRILSNIDASIGPIYTHGAIEAMNQVYRSMNLALPKTVKMDDKIDKSTIGKSLIIAPPSAIGSPWAKKIKNASEAVASGWMAVRGNRRRRGADKGFVLSDHVDWAELNEAVKLTGAQYIYPTHGYTAIFSKYLNEQGYIAKPVQTEYGVDDTDIEA